MMVASFMFVKRPVVSASAADETTTLITPVGVKMGPFGCVMVVFPR